MAFVLFEELFEHVQTLGPKALVEAQPLVRTGERSGFEAAQMGANGLPIGRRGLFGRKSSPSIND